MTSTITTALQKYLAAGRSSSLLQFARFGVVVAGFVMGSAAVGNMNNAQLAALKAAVRERDEKIASLTNDKKELEMKTNGQTPEDLSTGDDVQDWINSLQKE